MNMTEAVKSVLSQYVGFGGRARRSEYWYWTLATILVSIVIAFIEAALGLSMDGSGPISGLFSLAILLPGLAVTFRRLHDTGRSGWWIGGFYLGLFALVVIGGVLFASILSAGGESTAATGLGVFAIVVGLFAIIYVIALIVFLCQDSQVGPNKYGPNPKHEGNYDVFE